VGAAGTLQSRLNWGICLGPCPLCQSLDFLLGTPVLIVALNRGMHRVEWRWYAFADETLVLLAKISSHDPRSLNVTTSYHSKLAVANQAPFGGGAARKNRRKDEKEAFWKPLECLLSICTVLFLFCSLGCSYTRILVYTGLA